MCPSRFCIQYVSAPACSAKVHLELVMGVKLLQARLANCASHPLALLGHNAMDSEEMYSHARFGAASTLATHAAEMIMMLRRIKSRSDRRCLKSAQIAKMRQNSAM